MRRLARAILVTAAAGLVAGPLSGAAAPPVAAQDTTDTTTTTTVAAEAPAGNAITWSVAPSPRSGETDRPNFVIDAEPGETVTDSLVVTNRSDVNLVLGVYARDAFNTPDGKIDLLAGDDDPVDVGLWTTVETPSITVPAGGELVVPFSITIPADASPGDHPGGIVTTLTITEQDAQGNRVRVERRLGSRIYLRVAGELEPRLRFTKVKSRYEGSWNPFVPGKMIVDYTVANTGNVRLRAERIARVATGLGLPERTDEGDDMAELLPDNSYDLRQEVTGVWPAFGTGIEVELRPYDSLTANATGSAGGSSDVAPAPIIGRYRTSMFPTPQVITIVAVLLLLGLFWRSRRRSKRRMEKSIEAAVTKALADKSADNTAGDAAGAVPVPVGAPAHDPGTPPPWPPGTPPST